jgi:hypothetical protein
MFWKKPIVIMPPARVTSNDDLRIITSRRAHITLTEFLKQLPPHGAYLHVEETGDGRFTGRIAGLEVGIHLKYGMLETWNSLKTQPQDSLDAVVSLLVEKLPLMEGLRYHGRRVDLSNVIITK